MWPWTLVVQFFVLTCRLPLSRKRQRYENGENGEGVDDLEAAEEDTFEEDYPEVSVAGVMVPLLEITEEQQERMTPEEYQAYYETCQKYQ